MHDFFLFLVNHWGYIAGGLSVLGVAGASTMPEFVPKTVQEWWTWFRNTVQTSLPLHSMRSVQLPTSTPMKEPVISVKANSVSDVLAKFPKK